VFGLGQCINDTKKYDIEAEENKFDPEENVSIKTSSNNNIDCSDILRFFNGDFSKKYTIILIRYEQKSDTKCVKEIIEIAYTSVLRDHLFGTISGEVLQQYVDFVKAIPSGPVAEEIKKDGYRVSRAMFLEEEPKIADWRQVAAPEGPVMVLPHFLAGGLHGSEDVPGLLGIPHGREGWHEVDGRWVGYGAPIGTPAEMTELILKMVGAELRG
jgi:hypothetical protein